MRNENFFKLLSELDGLYLNKFLFLPYLKDIYHDLILFESDKNFDSYFYFSRILYPEIILSNGDYAKSFSKDYFVLKLPYTIFDDKADFVENQNTSTSIQEDRQHYFNEKVSYFSEKGMEIIKKFESIIEEIDRSDEEIINLI